MALIARILSIFLFLAAPSSAQAVLTRLHVPDASMIEFMIDGANNKVFLRNLNFVDNSWQGCCIAYWIELSTDYGKAQLSNLLSARYARGPIDIWVEKSGGPVVGTGNF